MLSSDFALALLEASVDELYAFDAETLRLVFLNRAARGHLGYGVQEYESIHVLDILSTFTNDRFAELLRPLYANTEEFITFEAFHVCKNGFTYEAEVRLQRLVVAERALFLANVRDVAERVHFETIIQRQSHYDALTMLPNRALFRQRLGQTIEALQRSSSLGGVLVIGLDNIKLVSDSLGPAAGDQLIMEVAHRISTTVRGRDTVARVADTEFGVIAPNLEQPHDAGGLAERLLGALKAPITVCGYQIVVPNAIGVTIFPDDGVTPETLLNNADTAMSGAREDDAVNYRFFTTALNQAARTRMAVRSGLSTALEKQEFSLVYQPKVDIHSWKVLGVEALLRWRNSDIGVVSPDTFIPVLERTGMINAVGEWVLETACRQRLLMKQAGFPEVRMAVNLSVRQIRWEFLEALDGILERTGLQPSDLELEVTESVIMKDSQNVLAILNRIAQIGVHLSMDDFGCGYSSLSHLRRLPLHTIKIDRSFITDLATVADDAEIVKAIIGMGHALRRHVVAEGVETVAQLALLRRLGCDQIQGYLFSPPISADDLMVLLTNARSDLSLIND
ncbi:diguanylate cyclase [Azospirillaceae bacterium]